LNSINANNNVKVDNIKLKQSILSPQSMQGNPNRKSMENKTANNQLYKKISNDESNTRRSQNNNNNNNQKKKRLNHSVDSDRIKKKT